MRPSFKMVDWDSNFFEMNVAQIVVNLSKENQEEIIQELLSEDVNLAYYYSAEPISIFQQQSYSVDLVDIKVTFVKDLNKFSPSKIEDVRPFRKEDLSEDMVDLAIASGIYSRFRKDKKIPIAKFEELYRMWLLNSINKQIAEEVFISVKNDSVSGFITVGAKQKVGNIGLIAVKEEFKGKGIGKSLMASAEKFVVEKFDKIEVVTQQENVPACKLYEACGYKLESKEYVYHLWKI